jgi:hypothetical protein
MTASSLVLDHPSTPAPTAIPTSTSAPATTSPGLGMVGARFPRAWAEPQALPPLPPLPPATTAHVFPTGCRFLRRPAADQQAYLATATPTSPVRPLSAPVGARFPRRTGHGGS